MDNHPIPQDVTGFKFRLIGSVTVKQFLYLLGFGILATVVFILPLNIFLKVPAMLFFALIGVSLAFVPIEGRPMDIMLVNFAKAIPSENMYIYKKRGANLSSFHVFVTQARKNEQKKYVGVIAKEPNPQDEKRAILLSRLRNSPFRPDESELERLKTVRSFFEEKAPQKSLPPEDVGDRIERPTKLVPPTQQEASLEQPNQKPKTSPPPQPTPERASPTLAGGFPTLPDVPNVVLGIVRDPRGKTLPNILVEVVDSNGVPVRAFKTNALGQFASATPLQNGTYKVYFEDPSKNHEFEIVEITLKGEIFTPLEITSIDAREKLRRELFGNQAIAT